MGKENRICLSIEKIDGVFSAFDTRPLDRRDISKTLVEQLVKKARGDFLKVSLVLKRRAKKAEMQTARKRLETYFEAKEAEICRDRWMKRFKGTAYVVFGGALLVAHNKTFAFEPGILNLVLVPAGWLLIFFGLENIVADWNLRSRHDALRLLKEADFEFSTK